MLRGRTVRTDPPQSVTVLLVDDDPVILRSHVRCLDGEFAVETCANAIDADRRVAEGGIDVVVSDVSMPGMSGFELIGAIRTRDAHLPVILASALSALESAENAINDGAFVYLTKPVDPATFRAAVRLAVQYRRSARRTTGRPSMLPSS
jgi:putative two-component system response regulator